jgi:hypothetical protein
LDFEGVNRSIKRSTLTVLSVIAEENEGEVFGAELHAQMSIAEKAKLDFVG